MTLRCIPASQGTAAPRTVKRTCMSVRCWAVLCVALGLILSDASTPPLRAAEMAARSGKQGTSKLRNIFRTQRKEAIEQIPFALLGAEEKKLVQGVVKNSTVYRRMTPRTCHSDPELYDFLLRHPEAVVHIWRQMGVTRVELNPTGDGRYHGNDGAGTDCEIRVLMQNKKQTLLYASGAYSGRLVKEPLHGECVMILTSRQGEKQDGQTAIEVRLDAFVKLHQPTAEFVAKTLNPVLGNIADHNFRESVNFLSSVSRSAKSNPSGMLAMVDQLEGMEAETRREFQTIILAAADRWENEEQGAEHKGSSRQLAAKTRYYEE